MLRKEIEKVSGRKPTATVSDADSTHPDSTTTDIKNDKIPEINKSEIKGFDRGLVAEEILGAIEGRTDIMFLIRWKGTTTCDLVPRKEANQKCPQVVIQFYQSRLKWIGQPNKAVEDWVAQNETNKENEERDNDEVRDHGSTSVEITQPLKQAS